MSGANAKVGSCVLIGKVPYYVREVSSSDGKHHYSLGTAKQPHESVAGISSLTTLKAVKCNLAREVETLTEDTYNRFRDARVAGRYLGHDEFMRIATGTHGGRRTKRSTRRSKRSRRARTRRQ